MAKSLAIKFDKRAAKNGWAPGGYICACPDCKQRYEGAKRSHQCADCAYSILDPPDAPRSIHLGSDQKQWELQLV